MKILAKDYTDRTSLMNGVVELTQNNTDSILISSIGIPSLRIPSKLRKVVFRLLPKDVRLDVPEADPIELESVFWWEHVEIQIDSSGNYDSAKWVSQETFNKIAQSWYRIDRELSAYDLDPDSVLSTRSISNQGSYSISKEDLTILLSMKGRSTIKEAVQLLGIPHDMILNRILKAVKYKLLGRREYLKNANYPESIKAMGNRLNAFYSNLKSWFGNTGFPEHNYFAKELALLSSKYPDAECLAVNPDGIDVDESVLSLSFSKDSKLVSSIGSKILKPLDLLFCNLVIGSAYAYSLDSVNRILEITDRNLAKRYSKMSVEELPIYLWSYSG